VVGAGRRAVEPVAGAGVVVVGAAVTGTVDVVVSGTLASDGDGPVARSRWLG